MTRFLLLLLVTHTRAAPLDPQVEQRELHNEAKAHHHRFAAWAESHGWHQDGHEQKSEHNGEGGDNMLSAAPLLAATQTELSCGMDCKTDADCPFGCGCWELCNRDACPGCPACCSPPGFEPMTRD